MNITIGIVGLPNSGKSTIFNALTKKTVPAENFPFCTIDPSVGTVAVPDERLEKLTKMAKSEKTIPTVIEFVDIAGLVRGASKGEGMGNEFLAHIRETSAIALVTRCFLDENIIHVDGDVNPVRDIEVVETELLIADIQTIERRLGKGEKEVKRGNKEAIAEKQLLEKVLSELKKGKKAATLSLGEEEGERIKNIGLLTIKPTLVVANIGQRYDEQQLNEVKDYANRCDSGYVTVAAQTEQELTEMKEEEAQLLREELMLEGGSIETVIKEAYRLLDLISFFTTGEKETRAWSIPKNTKAPKAARAIHTDFEKNFIRAEVIPHDELLKTGSYANARTAGLLRLEGKEYVVKDGDVIVFRTG